MSSDWIYLIYVIGSGMFFFLINVCIWVVAALFIGAIIGIIFLVLRVIFIVIFSPIIFIAKILFSPPVIWGVVVILVGWYYIH